MLHIVVDSPGHSNRLALQIAYAAGQFSVETLVVAELPDSAEMPASRPLGAICHVPQWLQVLPRRQGRSWLPPFVITAIRWLWIVRFVVQAKPDILHVHENPLIWVALLGSLSKMKVVWDPHDYFYDGSGSTPLRWKSIKRGMEKCLAWRGVPFLMVCEWMRDKYLSMYPGVGALLLKNYSVASVMGDSESAAKTAAGPRFETGGVLRVIYFGQVVKPRLPMEFIELVAKDEAIQFDIYGMDKWGNYLEEINDKIRQEAITNIRVMGAYTPTEIMHVLADYHYSVLPYQITQANLDFCLPNKFFQCVSAGLPMVVSNMRGLGGLVTKHGLGHVFIEGDYRQAIELIKTLPLVSPEYRELRARVLDHAATVLMDQKLEREALLKAYSS